MTDSKPNARRRADEVRAHIRRRVSDDGFRIAEVPLPGGELATLDEPDLDRLLSRGVGPAWYLNSNGRGVTYVRVDVSANFDVPSLAQVARLIMEPPPGCVIKYIDGDRLNLRRCNLAVVRGASRAKARERFFGEAAETAKAA